MKKVLFPALAIFTLLASAFTTFNAVQWQIADGYTIKFAGKDAEGKFEKFSGNLVFDEKNLDASKFSVSVDVSSIATGNGMKTSMPGATNGLMPGSFRRSISRPANFQKQRAATP